MTWIFYGPGEGPPTAAGPHTVHFEPSTVKFAVGTKFFDALKKWGGLDPEAVKAYQEAHPSPKSHCFR